MKLARVLSTRTRKRLPKKDFALPQYAKTPAGKAEGGSYPIPDASHARNALARVSQHGTAGEKAQVRTKVHAKYPNIGKSASAMTQGFIAGLLQKGGDHHPSWATQVFGDRNTGLTITDAAKLPTGGTGSYSIDAMSDVTRRYNEDVGNVQKVSAWIRSLCRS